MLAALELPRTEPKHYLSAVLALLNLNRPELAAPILKELTELKLDDEQRAALVDEFGSSRLLQLAHSIRAGPHRPAICRRLHGLGRSPRDQSRSESPN